LVTTKKGDYSFSYSDERYESRNTQLSNNFPDLHIYLFTNNMHTYISVACYSTAMDQITK